MSFFPNPIYNTQYNNNNNNTNSNDSTMEGLGQQFLSNAGIDTESLIRRARYLPSKATGSSSSSVNPSTAAAAASSSTAAPPFPTAATTTHTNTPSPDLLSFLQQSHNAFIQTTIDRQRENMQSVIQSKIQQRLQKNFYNTLSSLGHSQVIHRIRVPTVVTLDEEEDDYYGSSSNSGGSTDMVAAMAGSIPFQPCVTPTTDLLQNKEENDKGTFSSSPSPLLHWHLEYFPTISCGDHATQVVNFNALKHFTTTVNTATAHAPQVCNPESYSKMIAFLSSLLPSSGGTRTSDGTGTGTGASMVARNNVMALEYLCQQYQMYIIHTVKNSLMNQGQSSLNMKRGGLLGYIETFVQMELGVGQSIVDSNAGSSTWVGAYHALRCGDLDCVLDILLGANEGVESCVVGLLKEVCGGGGEEKGMKRLWKCMGDSSRGGGGGMGMGMVGKEDTMVDKWKRQVRELYERLQQLLLQEQQQQPGSVGVGYGGREYQLAVLGLLSFSPTLTESCPNIQKTSEDYVFMELYKGMESVQECRERVCDFAENIKHYGAAYFEDGVDESCNLWVYAMLLFYGQQVRSALNYLAGKSKDGLCVAVHLALALDQQGIALTDLVREEKEEEEDGQQPRSILARRNKNQSKTYLSLLVSTFARGLQHSSPPLALYYLLYIPGTIHSGIDTKSGIPLSKPALDKICRLLLDTRAFQLLGGTLAGDGSRLANGTLDRYFHKQAVSSILYHAAEYAIKEGKPADAAELLSLAGRYSDLLSLLNKRLSSLLLVTDDVQERTFWRQASEQFLETYMSKGHMHVIQVLEKERQLPVGNTFQMLLNLMEFFDRCQDNKWEVSSVVCVVHV